MYSLSIRYLAVITFSKASQTGLGRKRNLLSLVLKKLRDTSVLQVCLEPEHDKYVIRPLQVQDRLDAPGVPPSQLKRGGTKAQTPTLIG